MIVKLLNEHDLEFLTLKRGCTGLSQSTLVKMTHCCKSRVMAHIGCLEIENAVITFKLLLLVYP